MRKTRGNTLAGLIPQMAFLIVCVSIEVTIAEGSVYLTPAPPEPCGDEGQPDPRCNTTPCNIVMIVFLSALGLTGLFGIAWWYCGFHPICCIKSCWSILMKTREEKQEEKRNNTGVPPTLPDRHPPPTYIDLPDYLQPVSATAIELASAAGFTSTGSPMYDVSALAVRRLELTNRNNSGGGGVPDMLPRSTRFLATCKEPPAEKKSIYLLQFEKDGGVFGVCTPLEGSPLKVTGVYDHSVGLYRWAEVTPESVEGYHKESDPQAYATTLMESGFFHVEAAIRVHSKDELRGQYVSTTDTRGSIVLQMSKI